MTIVKLTPRDWWTQLKWIEAHIAGEWKDVTNYPMWQIGQSDCEVAFEDDADATFYLLHWA